MGFVITWLQLQGSIEFAVGMLPIPQLKQSFGQLVVGRGKRAVYLGGVAELDGSFAVLTLGKVTLSALQVFLLAHVRIARAASHKSGQKTQGDQCTKNGVLH